MSEDGGFSPRLMTALGGLAVILFALALLFSGGGGEPGQGDGDGANSYSKSAIGHRALYETLEKLGRGVVRADADPLGKLGDDGVLVLIEPRPGFADKTLEAKLASAKRILLVLPKYIGLSDREHPGWIREAWLDTRTNVGESLATLDVKARVTREAEPGAFTVNRFAQTPRIAKDRQRVALDGFNTLIGSDDGFLLGERNDGGRRILVLADPEPLENLGLTKGDNAAFALALFDLAAGSAKGKFVFDETLHGFTGRPAEPSSQVNQSPLRRMLNFPGNILAALALAAFLLLIGATTGRFGPPLAAPREREAGKAALIGSIAGLMNFGGHHAFALRRYVEGEIRETASAARAPAHADFAATLRWLDARAKSRGMAGSATDLIATARAAGPGDAKTLFTVAAAAHAFKEEMLNGTR